MRSEQLFVKPRFEPRVGFFVIALYQLDFLWVVGPQARAEEIVLPFRHVVILSAALLDRRPDGLPGLVGLIFPGDKAPIVTPDFFQDREADRFPERRCGKSGEAIPCRKSGGR